MNPAPLLAAGALVVIGGGVVAGLTGRIVVYRNYSDLVWCFALSAAPWSALLVDVVLLGAIPWAMQAWTLMCIALFLGLLLVIARRTRADNDNLLSTALAVVTKVPLGLLYIGTLAQMVGPSGKTAAARAASRRSAFLSLFLLTPLLLALTRDKEGFGARFPQMR